MPDLITTLVTLVNTIIAFVTVNPIYDLFLDINITNPKLSVDEDLNVSIFLEKFNLTSTDEEISVNLDYTISKRRSIVATGSLESIAVNDSIQKFFNISTSGIDTGKYTLNVKVSQVQSNPTESSEEFSKTNRPAKFRGGPFSNIFDFLRTFLVT